MGVPGEQQPVIRFGMHQPVDMPWDSIHPLTQTRRAMSAEGVEELKGAMTRTGPDGEKSYLMMHPMQVNVLGPDEAGSYVSDLNGCHGTSHSLADVPIGPDGRYYIPIAGHRRHRAAGEIITEAGASRTLSTVPVSPYEGLSFKEALDLQMAENSHRALSPTEEARAIRARYDIGLADGEFQTTADCVRALPFGESKIRTALRFCELPDFLQDWVEDGRLTYGVAVELHPLMEALRTRYKDKTVEEREKIVDETLQTEGLHVMREGWSRGFVAERIKQRVVALTDYEPLQLFAVDEVKRARDERNTAYRGLVTRGLELVRTFRELGDGTEGYFAQLPPEQQEAIRQELVSTAKLLGWSAGTETVSVQSVPTELTFDTSTDASSGLQLGLPAGNPQIGYGAVR